MTIPDYQTVMLPLLRFAADGQEHYLREAIEKLADHFQASPCTEFSAYLSGFESGPDETRTRDLCHANSVR
jgi:restriction system protein